MIEWAEHEFRLSKPDKDGVPARSHLEQVWKALGGKPENMPDDLKPPCEFPEHIGYVYEWYIVLAQCRSYSEAGPQPIKWQDIQAWSAVTGNKPTSEEAMLIMSLDAAFFRARA